MKTAESPEHYACKRAAIMWAFGKYPLITAEFNVPRSTWIADAFGYNPQTRDRAIFEAKASRSDFLKDFQSIEKVKGDRQKTQDLIAELDAETLDRAAKVERRLEELSPDSMVAFAALQTVRSYPAAWYIYLHRTNYRDGELSALHREQLKANDKRKKLMKRLNRTAKRGFKGNFGPGLGLAEYHYIIAPPGVVLPGEAPEGWGVLEVREIPELNRLEVKSVAKCVRQTSDPIDDKTHARLLASIARRNQSLLFKALGVEWTINGPLLPPTPVNWSDQ